MREQNPQTDSDQKDAGSGEYPTLPVFFKFSPFENDRHIEWLKPGPHRVLDGIPPQPLGEHNAQHAKEHRQPRHSDMSIGHHLRL